MQEMICLDIGRAAYEPTLRLQRRLVEDLQATDGGRAYLVLVEHDPPVITLGRNARPENVVASPQKLAEAGVEVHKIERGGDVTYHGPGQLVGYPIVRLDRRAHNVGRYVHDLESVLIRVLGRLGIKGHRDRRFPGVWVGNEKLAAIGIAVHRWVTYHGFALNICPDPAHFGFIVPCGIVDRGVTTVSKILERRVQVCEVRPLVIESMASIFGFTAMTMIRSLDDLLRAPTAAALEAILR